MSLYAGRFATIHRFNDATHASRPRSSRSRRWIVAFVTLCSSWATM